LPDVLNTIERWIASRGVKGPAERDSKKVEAYLLRLVDADQGLGGIEVAVECLKWMRLVLEDRHGVGESAEVVNATGADGTGQSPLRGQAKREWWSTWERFKSNVGEKVQLVLGAPLKL
jgi:DNA repair protein REV1